MLRRNCQIRGDRGKTVKFAEVAQIREFCKSRDARETGLTDRLLLI